MLPPQSVPAERYDRSGNGILRPSARILIDEAPPATQDLFGRPLPLGAV